MTSTFSVFRRNQTLGMAILVGVAILSFIVAPALTFVMQGSQRAMARGGKATIVRWRGGAIDEGGFERLNRVNYRCQAVLNQVLRDVLKAGGKPNVPNFTFDQRTGTERLAFYDPGVPTIERRFLFEKAKEAGVYLEDQAIDAYLLNLTDGRSLESGSTN